MKLWRNKSWNYRLEFMIGSIIFLFSFLIYYLTAAPTTSFWDCGEFIACSYTLSVMHPPGAPLFNLLGRLFSIIPWAEDIGLRVNIISVLVSAATVLLTFLVIIQLIKRWRGEPENRDDRIIVYVSSILGALAFAFSNSFWFNAVEAEVYAFSMFFTSLVVWLALRWGEYSEKKSSILLIFFIFYLFGLAVGMHLLNILAFPFVLLIVSFHNNQTIRRLFLLITIQAAVPLILYFIFYQFNPAKISYAAMLEHQARAGSFLLWFGLSWIILTLGYMFYKDKKVFYYWWVISLLILVAYSLYLVIYIRAHLDPPINENDPSTWSAMEDYLARKQYGQQSMILTFPYRVADFWNYQVNFMFNRYFGWQFIGEGISLDARDRIKEIISLRGLYGLPFLIGLFGAVHHFFRDWKRALAVFVLFFIMGYGIIIYLNQPDPQPRERDYSYIGAFFAFALWIGIGAAGVFEILIKTIQQKNLLKYGSTIIAGIVLFIAVPVNMFAFNFKSHDRSDNYVAWDYSYNILESCESNAILFTNGDNDTFPLWYLQEVEKIRKDVRVVNLSLLNTPWYIKQLKNREPRIPLSLSETRINQLSPVQWKSQKIQIPVPEKIINELQNQLPPEEYNNVKNYIEFTLKPTITSGNRKGLRVQDIMILQIIHATQWQRPVYFSLTVSHKNKLNLNSYLRMDGIVFKLVPYTVKNLDPEIMNKNLFNKYKYRNLDNPEVYYNVRIQKLIQNYRTAFNQLAEFYIKQNNKEKAIQVLDAMNQIIPPEIIPFSSEMAAIYIVDTYIKAGKMIDYKNYTEQVIPGIHQSRNEKLRLASFYMGVLNEPEQVERLLYPLLEKYPDDDEIYMMLVRSYQRSGNYKEAIKVLDKLAQQYPDDAYVKKEIERLKKLVENKTNNK
ncbi:MAG: DUF2723 domain-containing protein [bacterium]